MSSPELIDSAAVPPYGTAGNLHASGADIQ